MEWFIPGFFGLLAMTLFICTLAFVILVAGRPSTRERNRCAATPSAGRAPAAAAEWDRVALLR